MKIIAFENSLQSDDEAGHGSTILKTKEGIVSSRHQTFLGKKELNRLREEGLMTELSNPIPLPNINKHSAPYVMLIKDGYDAFTPYVDVAVASKILTTGKSDGFNFIVFKCESDFLRFGKKVAETIADNIINQNDYFLSEKDDALVSFGLMLNPREPKLYAIDIHFANVDDKEELIKMARVSLTTHNEALEFRRVLDFLGG